MFLSSLLILGAVRAVLGKTQLYGMNIAGFEFGCLITGDCPLDTIQPPLASLGFGDGAGQMAHFAKDDSMNIFRLPVSWQYLTNNVIGPIDDANFATYDLLMQACLKTGAYCMIDIHNFARWNGGIIGQGGPTNDQFADLWSQLATKYADNAFVMFELMNEPHDLDLTGWVASCQAAVTAIRAAEKVSHIILLPGENFSSAGTFLSAGWGPALATVTNPDGSTTNLLLDLHKYLDVDNSGDHPNCVMDNVADTFEPVAAWLRLNKRQAILSETGAGVSDQSCFVDFCAQNTCINQNSDVYLGYIAWAAGSVDSSYMLDLAPVETGTTWTDVPMAVKCVIGVWDTDGPGAPAWGLTLNADGIAAPSSTVNVTSSTSSAASSSTSSTASSTTTSTGITTSTTKSGSATQTSHGPSSTQSKTSSASGAKMTSGFTVGSLILAALFL
ncbi:glycoside hydrolase family 5 protein [Hyaloscypha variabilis F]|jgi:endoglucanase|uniref:Endoglucanase EG-II n=1 Tax=Hyaloscypha variabilis (strain UAMH 11265 / GT02V1 / F) TaxID=1149755 RepID=A0A2J6QY55_HYAVF|nr:glycoside hydrolase family 5 protein [Hyaloscypha variabilis F]